jgi:hypothetical protein
MVRLAFSRAYRFPTGLLSDEHSRPFWLIHSAAYPLLLVRDDPGPFLERLERAYTLLQPRVAMDIVVYTEEEIEDLKDANPFAKRALKEGVVVYEAPSQC